MRNTLLIALAGTIGLGLVWAQTAAPFENRIADVLARMASNNLPTRNTAIDDLTGMFAAEQQLGADPRWGRLLDVFLKRHPTEANKIKTGLINLLNAENGTFLNDQTPPGTYTEGDTEHYAIAVEMVASLDDERAIPALVGAIQTGHMASDALLKFGAKALGPVTDALKNGNAMQKADALGVAIQLLRRNKDRASDEQILAMIRSALVDPSFLVRGGAITEIEHLAAADQEQFVPLLREIASEDPFFFVYSPSGQKIYSVRGAAESLLKKIAK